MKIAFFLSLSAFFLLTSKLSHGQITSEIESNSSITVPQLLLREIGQDFARLTFENTAQPSKFWTLAAETHITTSGIPRANFYYHDGLVGKDILTITGTGRVGINRTDPFVAFHVNGYTKLGDGSPRIQMKTITGTTPNCTECTMNVDHGIDDRKKIISVQIFVDFDFMGDPNSEFSYSTPVGYHYLDTSNDRYYYKVYKDHIRIYNNLSNINQAQKPFRMLITYCE